MLKWTRAIDAHFQGKIAKVEVAHKKELMEIQQKHGKEIHNLHQKHLIGLQAMAKSARKSNEEIQEELISR